ncbi:UbiA family prenyltransferase [Natronobeatus ordinarius]|uniref:UbiA family prenyltransferase n=1 Tax=Natronobeatus ordinarius TaxID=2963433 RepID=UPI0020CDBE4E|nr:UbiA family prenyltransferase [Natronobeatus ordinarius]
MTNQPTLTSTRRGLPALKAALLVAVHSNFFISLAATSVAVTTIVLAGFRLEVVPLFIVFTVTLFVYSVNRLTDLAEDERNVPGRAAFTRRYGRLSLALGVLGYLVAIALAIAWGLPLAGFLVLPLLVVLLYSTLQLKQVFLVKNLVVGAAWGVIPLGVGVYFGDLWRLEILFLAAHVGAMITVAAVIFDVKDIEGDRAEGIRTVPNVYGPRATRIVSQAANVAVAVGVVAFVVAGALPASFLVLLSFHGYVGGYVPFATPERTPLFYGFVVDGEHVFLAVVVLTLELLGVLG